MIYDVVPVPKPRMTRSDKWKLSKGEGRNCVVRYFTFCDQARRAKIPYNNDVSVIFHMPMPKSWRKRKRDEMRGHPHKSRPDLDNLIKALSDAVCPEDSHIWRISAFKIWADKGCIEVRDRCSL